MQILKGSAIAEGILRDTREKIAASKVAPGLAVLLIGSDPSSRLYVGIKERRAREVGILFERIELPDSVSESEVLFHLRALNGREDIHGIVIQMPLPEALDPDVLIAEIEPDKDTDGFHPATLERFLSGDSAAMPVFPRAVQELLLSSGRPLDGAKSVVLANSMLLSDVMRTMLASLGARAITLVLPEDEAGLETALATAAVVVTALGRPKFLKGRMFAPGALVIDGGVTPEGDGVAGDVDRAALAETNIMLTPVPGGVGPVTVAILLARVTEAAMRRAGLQR